MGEITKALDIMSWSEKNLRKFKWSVKKQDTINKNNKKTHKAPHYIKNRK